MDAAGSAERLPALALYGEDAQLLRSTDTFRSWRSEFEVELDELDQVLSGERESARLTVAGAVGRLEPVTDEAGTRRALLTVTPLADRGPSDPIAWIGEQLESSAAIAWLKDLDGRYLRINPRFSDQLGIAPDRIRGRRDDELSPGETVDGPRLREREFASEPLELEYSVAPYEGRPGFAVLRFALHDRDHHPIATCGVAAPVVEAQVAESECVRLVQLERLSHLDAPAARAEVLADWGIAPAGAISPAFAPAVTSPPDDASLNSALAELDAARELSVQLEEQLREERSQASALHEASITSSRRAEELSSELGSERERRGQLEHALGEAHSRLAELQTQPAMPDNSGELRARAERAEASAQRAHGELETVRAELAARDGALDAIRAELAERDSALDAIRAELAERDSALDATRAELAEAARSLGTDQIRREETIAALGAARAELSERDRALEAARAGLGERDRALETLRAELAEATRSRDADSAERAESLAALDAVRAELAEQAAALEGTRRELAERDGALQAARAELAEHDRALETLRHELAEASRSHEVDSSERAESLAAVDAVRAELAEKAAALDGTRRELAERDGALQAAQAQLAEREQALRSELAERDRSLETLRAELAEASRSHDADSTDRADTLAALQDVRAQLAERDRALEAVRHELAEAERLRDANQTEGAHTLAALGATRAELSEKAGALDAMHAQLADTQGAMDAARAEIARLTHPAQEAEPDPEELDLSVPDAHRWGRRVVASAGAAALRWADRSR